MPVDYEKIPHDQRRNDHRQGQGKKHQNRHQKRRQVTAPFLEQVNQVNFPEPLMFHALHNTPEVRPCKEGERQRRAGTLQAASSQARMDLVTRERQRALIAVAFYKGDSADEGGVLLRRPDDQ